MINYTVRDTSPASVETKLAPRASQTTTTAAVVPESQQYSQLLTVLCIVAAILLLMEIPILIGTIHSRASKRRDRQE